MLKVYLKYLDEMGFYDYYFIWGQQEEACVIVLGYGLLYNYSYCFNVFYLFDFEGNVLYFMVFCDLKVGEEIIVNYNGYFGDEEEVWFMV